MDDPYRTDLRDILRLPEVFYIGLNIESLMSDLAIEAPEPFQPILETFKSNIRALAGAAQLPFLLTFYATYRELLNRHLIAAHIRAIDPEDVIKKEKDPEYEKSDIYIKKMQERNAQFAAAASEEFRLKYINDEEQQRISGLAFETLVPFLDHPIVSLASKELMRESIVLIWIALEALATDLFVSTLNYAPQFTVLILRDEQCKKRFQSKDLARIIESHGFDLSNRMGEVLKSLGNLDDPETIKAVFRIICPNNESLRTVLSESDLWRLYQRRNLLVHRAGIVDKHFLEKTGENFEIGTKLPVVSDDVNRYLKLVVKIASELARGVTL